MIPRDLASISAPPSLSIYSFISLTTANVAHESTPPDRSHTLFPCHRPDCRSEHLKCCGAGAKPEDTSESQVSGATAVVPFPSRGSQGKDVGVKKKKKAG